MLTTIMCDGAELRERRELRGHGNSHGNKCGGYVSQVICRFFLFNEIKDLRVFRFFFEAKSTKYVAYMTTI